MTTFYCIRFETPPTWRARSPYLYPPGTGWPSYTPKHFVHFSSPPTTRRATVEALDPALTSEILVIYIYIYSLGADPQKTPLPLVSTGMILGRPAMGCLPIIFLRGNVFAEPLPSNGHLWLHYSGFRASCHNIIHGNLFPFAVIHSTTGTSKFL
jgi:hypothetical protein